MATRSDFPRESDLAATGLVPQLNNQIVHYTGRAWAGGTFLRQQKKSSPSQRKAIVVTMTPVGISVLYLNPK
jgi:hypothetical protein